MKLQGTYIPPKQIPQSPSPVVNAAALQLLCVGWYSKHDFILVCGALFHQLIIHH